MDSQPCGMLIVDDNEMNRDMLARRLERKGYVIQVAEGAVFAGTHPARAGGSGPPGCRDAGNQRS
jgi:CheY-like chemotaxis protein